MGRPRGAGVHRPGLAPRVRGPTPLVRADGSFHRTAWQAAAAGAIPHARPATAPGSHHILQDNPEGLWEVIRHEGLA